MRLLLLLIAVFTRVACDSCKFFDLFCPGFVVFNGEEKSEIQEIQFEDEGRNMTAKILLDDQTNSSTSIECNGYKNLILAVFEQNKTCTRWFKKKDVVTSSMASDQLGRGNSNEVKMYLAHNSTHNYLTVISVRKHSELTERRVVKLSPDNVLLNNQVKFEVFQASPLCLGRM